MVRDYLEEFREKMRKDYEDTVATLRNKIKEVASEKYEKIEKLNKEIEKNSEEEKALQERESKLYQMNRELQNKVYDIKMEIDNMEEVKKLESEINQIDDKFDAYMKLMDREIKNAESKQLKNELTEKIYSYLNSQEKN